MNKKIKEIEGNLIELFKQDRFDAIAHGCNCQVSMSGGIAYQLAKHFPELEYVDRQHQRQYISDFIHHHHMVGTISSLHTEYGDIYNLYTQYTPGADFRLEALIQACRKLNDQIPWFRRIFRKPKLGLPLIGCGIGGGRWSEVKYVLETELSNWDVTVVHFK